MKLEAFWILTNLCFTDNIDNLLIFLGENTENVMNDINYSLSEPIVALIDRNLKALIDDGSTDMKTFSQALWTFGNMLSREGKSGN